MSRMHGNRLLKVSSEVSASSRRIIRNSDSPRNACSMSRSLLWRMVSKAQLRPLAKNLIDTCWCCALAQSQHYPNSTSAVLRLHLNPNCEGDMYFSTFGVIIDRTTRNSVFLNVVSRTIGRSLVSGPFGLLLFCMNMSASLKVLESAALSSQLSI